MLFPRAGAASPKPKDMRGEDRHSAEDSWASAGRLFSRPSLETRNEKIRTPGINLEFNHERPDQRSTNIQSQECRPVGATSPDRSRLPHSELRQVVRPAHDGGDV